jgi:hypothetical protein
MAGGMEGKGTDMSDRTIPGRPGEEADWLDEWLTERPGPAPGGDDTFVVGVMRRVRALPVPLSPDQALRRAERLKAQDARERRFTLGGMAVGALVAAAVLRASDIYIFGGAAGTDGWLVPIARLLACAVTVTATALQIRGR